MRKQLTIFILLNCFSGFIHAITYHTHYSGLWSNNSVWDGGIAPAVTTSDTIIISKFIEFNSTLEFLSGAYVLIDSSGALCGHDTIIFNTGSDMAVYGLLECDVFLVPGGHINFYSSARIIWTQYAQLTVPGASLNSSGAAINTGVWFNCLGKGTDIADTKSPSINIRYETASRRLIVDDCNNVECTISDMSGRIVFYGRTETNQLQIVKLPSGIFAFTISCGDKIFRRRIFVE